MNKYMIFLIVATLLFIIGCNSQEEKVTSFQKQFLQCEELGGEIKYDSQCYLKNGVIITAQKKINLNNCKSFYDGCNECEIINANSFNLKCNTAICFTYEEPACRDSEFNQENTVCTQEDLPVCGVDGITYPNECVARENNIEIKTFGSC